MILLALTLGALASNGAASFDRGVQRAVEGDLTGAAASFESACAAGHSRACANLATLLQQGAGLPADPARATQLHRKACEADLALSCDALGTLTANGVGLPRDDASAIALYEKACALGHGPGCTHLGVMHDGGFGVPRSWEAARTHYGRGCDLGDAEACLSLGTKLLGLRRPDTTAEGARRLEQACTHDHAEACAMAASLYARGELIARDPAKARSLHQRACALGHAEGCP